MQKKEPHIFPYGNFMVEIGKLFLHKPYKSGTLEGFTKEKLIVNVSAFDCTTFVETVLALARCAVVGKCSNHEFRKHLKSIRYGNGKISGYSSRLHYFTDWLRDNEKKGVLTDITRRFNGTSQRKQINFMTAHRESYPALGNEKQFANMAIIEKNLSRRTFHIIEKDKVCAQMGKLASGDIIAFATHQEGLDVAHMGFALWEGKRLRLLHASSKEGSVVISKKTLAAYLRSNKEFTGIIVARPLF